WSRPGTAGRWWIFRPAGSAGCIYLSFPCSAGEPGDQENHHEPRNPHVTGFACVPGGTLGARQCHLGPDDTARRREGISPPERDGTRPPIRAAPAAPRGPHCPDVRLVRRGALQPPL